MAAELQGKLQLSQVRYLHMVALFFKANHHEASTMKSILQIYE